MYEDKLSKIVAEELDRLISQLQMKGEALFTHAVRWMNRIAGEKPLPDYFKHTRAFPIILLPWYAEKSLGKSLDLAFQKDLVYSSINAYYYSRLIDNIMDSDAVEEPKILPVLSFFHMSFQSTYHSYFEHSHPFWKCFWDAWSMCAEVTIADAHLKDIGESEFIGISAHKTSAAKIPICAVLYRNRREDLLPKWSEFVGLFGRWHQMLIDLFGWQKDINKNIVTYLTSEAKRQKAQEESVGAWVAREGFSWAMNRLESWMQQMKTLAKALRCSDLYAYLELRENALFRKKQSIISGFAQAQSLVEKLRGTGVC